MPALKGRTTIERRISRRLAALLRAILAGELPLEALAAQVADLLTSELSLTFSKSFNSLGDLIGTLTNQPQAAEALSRQYSVARATSVAKDLAANIASDLADGREPAAFLTPARAESIAVSEVTIAVTTAETTARNTAATGVAELVQADVPVNDGMIAVWIDSGLANVCPICSALDRQTEDEWRDRFPFGPPAHPNCNCHLEYVPAGKDLSQWRSLRK